jgi:hypothetical protein
MRTPIANVQMVSCKFNGQQNTMQRFLKVTWIIVILTSLSGCRPPLKIIKDKERFYKSYKSKNALSANDTVLINGTFFSVDSGSTSPKNFIVRFNKNHTVQLSNNSKASLRPLEFNNSTILYYLEDKVSYYYFVDRRSNTLILERFEYWESPWWNFFAQTEHYLLEKFSIKGDTLINQEQGRFTRFSKSYVIDRNVTANFDRIENEFRKN